MRIPNPKAVTTTEAYLAYKAEVLEQSELKDKLYHPYLHIDGWLAYWTGLTATYPTDKNGDPECLTDEEAYIAYLSGVTSEYPEALKDPADVRVASYLRYLISARFGRPDYPVTREEFYLSMMKPRFIPSGDPSSEIELDGTVEAPFIDVKMYGDTFQQTYSGTNLLPSSGLTPETYTGGLTITPVYNTNNELMYILANGTYTGESYFYYHIGDMSFIEGETYTCSGSIGGSGSTYRIWVSASTAFPLGNRLSSTDGAGTATASASQDNGSVDIQIYPNATLDNVKFYPQIELNSESTSYEPYVGGTASPNPDYPQDIDVVTGRQNVWVHGKNLFDEVEADMAVIGLGSHGRLLASTVRCSTKGFLTVKPNTTYTVSAIPGDSNKRLQVFDCCYSDKDENTFVGIYPEDKWYNLPFSFTTGDDCNYARLGFRYSDNSTMTTSDVNQVQLEESSIATDYQPYQGQSYEVNLIGKNLFNKEQTDKTTSGNVTVSTLPTGIRVIQADATSSGTYRYVVYTIGDTADYVGKTLTLSANMVASSTNAPRVFIGLCNADGSSVSGTVIGDNSPATISKSITQLDANTKPKICLGFYATAGVAAPADSYADYTDVQLEVGSTATPYAPYFEPIELCKIGDYQDYIYKSGDDWYVHKEIRHQSFAISDMNNSTNYPGWKNLPQLITDLGTGINRGLDFETSFISNITGLRLKTTEANTKPIYVNTTNEGILYLSRDYYGSDYTQTYWRSNYSSLRLELYYGIINTPTDTKITNSELIAQLDALMEGGSYNGKTYIKVTATDPNLPGLLYVEAAI